MSGRALASGMTTSRSMAVNEEDELESDSGPFKETPKVTRELPHFAKKLIELTEESDSEPEASEVDSNTGNDLKEVEGERKKGNIRHNSTKTSLETISKRATPTDVPPPSPRESPAVNGSWLRVGMNTLIIPTLMTGVSWTSTKNGSIIIDTTQQSYSTRKQMTLSSRVSGCLLKIDTKASKATNLLAKEVCFMILWSFVTG